MAGLPRSGSTVLASILNQNKKLYVTPTSPLLDLLYLNEQEWHKCPSVIANKYPVQLENISKAIINGCWEHIPQDIIIDKHRAHCRNLRAIEHIFGNPPKIIVTVRDIPSIIASFLKLIHKSNRLNKPNFVDKVLYERGESLIDDNRANLLWNEYIQDPWDSFKTGFKFRPECLKLVDYDDLINNPNDVLTQVYDFLGLDYYQHDFDNIENQTQDDDLIAWGLDGLHTIQPKLQKYSGNPTEILGNDIVNKYNKMNLEFWK